MTTDYEHGIIGAVLAIDGAIVEADRQLRDDYFSDPFARAAWLAAVKLHRAGVPLTPTLLVREIRDKKPFDSNESAAAYLYECGQQTVGPELFRHHVREVREAGRKRRLASIAASAHEGAMNGKSGSEVANALLADVEDWRREDETEVPRTEKMFDRWAQGVVERERPATWDVAPHNSELNQVPVGENIVTLFGAPPGWGKTLLVMQLIFDALELPEQEHLRAR